MTFCIQAVVAQRFRAAARLPPGVLRLTAACLIPAMSITWFILAGMLLIPYPGLQNDELFFAGPLYYPEGAFYSVTIGATRIPLMVMSYTGALKTWLYAGLFAFFEPNRWSVRVPMLLLGAGTIWLTWKWVRRIAGLRAASVATVLLATDAMFLFTNDFDWGPVALQHILLMAGLLAMQLWLATNSRRMLALAFFLWGLGMWDKALMSWPLIGLAVAAACVYPRLVLRRVRPYTLLIAVGSFLVGAAPLVVYNIDRPGETATTNAKFTTSGLDGKVIVLRETVNGEALHGYIVADESAPSPRAPRTRVERLSVWIATHLGDHHTNLMIPAYLLGLLVLPFLWGTTALRPLLFLLIALIVEWLQMAFNRGTGGAAHHTILLWPLNVAFLGIAFSVASRRIPRGTGLPLLMLIVAVLAGANVLNTNQYLSGLTLYGSMGGWTDAVYSLSNSLAKNTASHIGLVDWGCLTPLELLHEGELPLFIPPIPQIGEVPTAAARTELQEAIKDPARLYIQHTDDKQLFLGINDRLRKAASEIGYTEDVERLIHDRNGRPVFQLFRFRKAS